MIEVCKTLNGLEKAKKEFAISHNWDYEIGRQVKQYGEVLNKQKDGMSFPHRLWSSVTRDVTEAKSMNGFQIGSDNLMRASSTQDCSGLWEGLELVDC